MARMSAGLILTVLVMLSFLPVPAGATGGNAIWQVTDTVSGLQESRGMAVDSTGAVVLAGRSDQSGSNDFHVVKFAADGSSVMWRYTYDRAGGDDAAESVVVDSQGDVIVTGYVWNGQNYDIYTVKLKGADGTVIWSDVYNGTINGHDYGTALTVDSIDNVYVAGYTHGSAGDDIVVIKYSPSGIRIWSQTYDGGYNGNDRAYSIHAGLDGVAVTGLSQNSTPDFDCLTLKYGFDGTLRWAKRYSNAGDDRGVSVGMDTSGNVIMTGYIYNGSDRDIYTVKYSGSDGTVLWERIYNSGHDEEPEALSIDSAGDVYITGYTFGLSSGKDFFTARYDTSNGTEKWHSIFNSTDGYHDVGLAIAVDPGGDVFVTGSTFDIPQDNYHFQTLKLSRATGALLWQSQYDGTAGKNDIPTGIFISPSDGGVLVGGWTDRWTNGSSDYDFHLIKYDPGLLNPPTDLQATTVSTTEIDLAWSDNSSNEDGFRIERRTGYFGIWTEIATVGADVTTYSDTGLTPDTRYYYRVRAYNATEGNSHYSNEATAKTTLVSIQPPSWVFTYDGADSGDDYANAIAVGPDNNPVATGFSFSNMGQFDYYTIKLDRTTGNLIWEARYDSDQNDLDMGITVGVDSDNDVIVSGYSYLYSPGAGRNTNDIYTILYPSTGPPSDWEDQYNGPSGDDDRSSAVAVSHDSADNYAVVGYGRNSQGNDDIYLIKYVADGTRAWEITPFDNGGNDYPTGVVFDNSGNVIVCGYVHNGTDYDFFTAKYRGSDGTQMWFRIESGSGGDDRANSVGVDSNGNIYVTGYITSADGDTDFYTVKYDTSGGKVWERTFDGSGAGDDEAVSVKIDPLNNEVVVGGTTITQAGDRDFHIIRYDPAGNVLWEKTYERPGLEDRAVAMGMDISGNVCLAGNVFNGTDNDVLSIKYNYLGEVIGATLYQGQPGGYDEASGVAVNTFGEAFIAGYTINASGNADYLIFKCAWDPLQVPLPFTLTPHYAEIDLNWADNSLTEDGYYIERKQGDCSSTNPWSAVTTTGPDVTHYKDTALNFNTTYCYRIRAFNNTTGEVSRWIEQSTTTNTPQPPTGVTATVVDTTTIEISWTDTTTNEEGFQIKRCDGTGCTPVTVVGTVPPDTTTFTDNTACPGSIYTYSVTAYRTGLWSVDSSTTEATTPSVVAPVLTVDSSSEEQVVLTWTDGTTDEDNFSVERCQGAGCTDFTEVATLPADTVTYTDTGLQFNSYYRYRVAAVKTGGCGWPVFSNVVDVDTTVQPPVLSITTVDSTTLDLSWTDTTTTEDGFRIERCEGAGCSSFTEIASLPSDTTTYRDDTVCSGTSYTYRVMAYRTGQWQSGYSNESTIDMPVPGVVSDLTVRRVSEAELSLRWTYDLMDVEGFRIQRCQGAGCTDFTDFDTVVNPGHTYPELDGTELLVYRMDESSWGGYANEVVDSSGNGNHGTARYGATTVSGLINRSGSFDGIDDYIAVSGLKFDQPGQIDAITVEAWINTTDTYAAIVDWDRSEYFSLGINFDNTQGDEGRVSWDTTSETGEIHDLHSTIRIDDGQWHHVVATYDSSTGEKRIYIDGVLDSSVQAYTPGTRLGTGSTRYGFIGDGSEATYYNGSRNGVYYGGLLDSVIIYNRALSDTEIKRQFKGFSYSDTSVQVDTTYRYRIYAYKNAICPWEAGPGNEAEATTTLLGPDNLTASLVTDVSCDDLRFTLSDGATEIPYWIESNCGSNDTRVWVRIPSLPSGDSTIYLYSHNPTAPQGSNGDATFLFFDDFQGQVIDTSKWVEIDTLGKINQDNDLILKNVNNNTAWDSALISTTAFARSNDLMVAFGLTTPSSMNSYDRAMMGWEKDQTTNAYYNRLLHGLYWSAGQLMVFESGSNRGLVGTVSGGTDYEMRVQLKSQGARYLIKGGQYSDWTVLQDNSYYSDSYVRVGLHQTASRYRIHQIRVQKYAQSEITATPAEEEPGTYNLTGGVWYLRRPYTLTNPNSDLTDFQVLISIDTQAEEKEAVSLTWTDNTATEDGFEIMRCTGTGCDTNPVNFTSIGNTGPDQAEFTDRDVLPSTTYCYKVVAFRTGLWQSPESNVSCITTSDVNSPSNLSASAVSESEVELTWTDTVTGETGFIIERCQGAGCSTFSEIGRTGTNQTTFTDNTACSGTDYTYRVKAYRAGEWESNYSNEASATTSVPGAPDGLTGTGVSETQIDLSWNDNSIAETYYSIERCEGTGCTAFVEVATTGRDGSTYSDTGLQPSTTYRYRVKAVSSSACGWQTGYSNEIEVSTVTPAPPSDLSATPVDTTTVELTWTDNTTSETAFRIQRCEGAGCTNFADLATTGPDVTTYTDDTACAGTTYRYQVRAEKTDGPVWNTAWSTPAEVTTVTIQAPTLTATRASEFEIDLSWDDNYSDETGFRVERCEGVGCADFVEIDSVATDMTSYNDVNLNADTTYTYRVIAYKTANCPWEVTSNTASATTTVMPPDGLNAAAYDTTTVKLDWNDNTAMEDGFIIERCTGSGCTDFQEIGRTDRNTFVLYLPMDEAVWNGTPNEVKDLSGHLHNGNRGGNATTTSDSRYGRAGYFDGTNDYVNLGDINELDSPGYLTVELWFKRLSDQSSATNQGINNVLIAQSSYNSNDNLEIGTEGTNIEFYIDSSSGYNGVMSVDAGIQDNVWYHLVLTYNQDDPNEVKLYLNGTKIAEWPDYSGVLTSSGTSPLTIGMARPSSSTSGQWGDYHGLIDEVAIYTRALTDTEVKEHYTSHISSGTTYYDGTVCAGQTYTYQVRAYRSGMWTSSPSNTSEVTLSSPLEPDALSVESLYETENLLTWHLNTTDESGTRIERCQGAGCSSFTEIGITGAGVESYTDSSVTPSTDYCYRVSVFKNALCPWQTNYAGPICMTSAPSAPSGLTASPVNSKVVKLQWTDNSSDEDGFIIEVKVWGGFWSEAGRVGPDVTTFNDSAGVQPDTSYTYRVRAYRGTARSLPSNEASATTPPFSEGDSNCVQ
jgi:uncharacterized delta-60 repeat protein